MCVAIRNRLRPVFERTFAGTRSHSAGTAVLFFIERGSIHARVRLWRPDGLRGYATDAVSGAESVLFGALKRGESKPCLTRAEDVLLLLHHEDSSARKRLSSRRSASYHLFRISDSE